MPAWIIVVMLFAGDTHAGSRIFLMDPVVKTADDCEKSRKSYVELTLRDWGAGSMVACVPLKFEPVPVVPKPLGDPRTKLNVSQ